MPVQNEPYPSLRENPRKKRSVGRPAIPAILVLMAVLYASGCAGASDAPSVSLSPASLAFGNQATGTKSSAQSISLKNTGSATLSIMAIELTGAYPNQYIQTNNCGTSLAVGATCTISVQFAPINLGSINANVSLVDNASNSPQSVSLSGTGVSSPSVSLSPTSLTFGNQESGTTSSAQSISLKNTGNGALSITTIALIGAYPNQYIETNNCGTSLAVGATCYISVQFAPINLGSITANVSLVDNASNSPQSVPLSGTGTSIKPAASGASESPAVSLSPTSLSFGNQPIDVASSSQTVTLENTGGAALSVSSIALTGTDPDDFTENNTCGSSVAAGGSCTIVCMLTPSASGSLSASLSVTDNASGSPQTVALSGTGVHDIILSWSASSGAAGYDVYRGTTSGGESSTPINSALVTGTTYIDTAVDAGQTYYYKLTTVGSSGTQSAESKEASATVP